MERQELLGGSDQKNQAVVIGELERFRLAVFLGELSLLVCWLS